MYLLDFIFFLIFIFAFIYLSFSKKVGIGFIFFALIFSFFLVILVRPFSFVRYLFYFMPLLFLFMGFLFDKFLKDVHIKYLFCIWLLLVNLVYFNFREVKFISLNDVWIDNTNEILDAFLNENKEAPLLLVLDDEWRGREDESNFIFDKSFKDWTVIKVMPFLYNRKKLYITEENLVNFEKVSEVLNDFSSPERIYIISAKEVSSMKTFYKNCECELLKYKKLCYYYN